MPQSFVLNAQQPFAEADLGDKVERGFHLASNHLRSDITELHPHPSLRHSGPPGPGNGHRPTAPTRRFARSSFAYDASL